MMDIHHLKVFTTVAEKKSFTLAAEELFLTQPTVSSHIKHLEQKLGTPLFDRLPRGIALTRAGEILYGYSQEILGLQRKALEAIQEFCGNLKGLLKAGGSNIPGEYILPGYLNDFRQAAPEVTLNLEVADSREITTRVLNGDLEVGLVGALPEQDVLESTPFCSDQMVLITPASHHIAREKMKKVKLESFLGEPFWLRESGSGTRKALMNALAAGNKQLEDLNIAGELGSTEAVKQAVKHQGGLSVVSAYAVRDEVECGKLWSAEISGLDLNRDFHLIRHRYRTPSPAARFFYDFLLEAREKRG